MKDTKIVLKARVFTTSQDHEAYKVAVARKQPAKSFYEEVEEEVVLPLWEASDMVDNEKALLQDANTQLKARKLGSLRAQLAASQGDYRGMRPSAQEKVVLQAPKASWEALSDLLGLSYERLISLEEASK